MPSLLTDYNEPLQDFIVRLSNSSNIDEHKDICAYHPGYIPSSGRAVLPCDRIKAARYLSVTNKESKEPYQDFYMCEVVVIGVVAAGMYTFFSNKHHLFLKRFIRLVEAHYHKVNLNSDNKKSLQ